jgi:LmbE family N-acetylglucosaminyl deacetylase
MGGSKCSPREGRNAPRLNVHDFWAENTEGLSNDDASPWMHREIEWHGHTEPHDLKSMNWWPRSRRQHTDSITCLLLGSNETHHLSFDTTGARREAVRDMHDMHVRTVRHNAVTMPHPSTLVFVHAHPDDEALLTAGTMARAVAEGNRVVLVVATDGGAGLTSRAFAADLSTRRSAELQASARAIGVHRCISLGYPDSGLSVEGSDGFASADRFEIAREIAKVLDDEDADVVVGYDPRGGYGHPDHLQVHRTVRAASVLARRSPRLFEATLPREPIRNAVHLAARLHLTPRDFDPTEFDDAWTPGAEITHRVNVAEFLDQKRNSLRAHASQAAADGTVRTLGVLSRLPKPVLRTILGTEYYVLVSDPSAARTSSTELEASTHTMR